MSVCEHKKGVIANHFGSGFICTECGEEIADNEEIMCPKCKQKRYGSQNIGWIREFGHCLMCDEL